MGYRGFLDANVLVPARPRDVLLTLGHAGLYVPLWSEAVLDEVRRHLPQRMTQDERDHLFRTMAEAFPEARTDAPERLDVAVRGVVNAKDEHVLAAALWARADVIVTDDVDLCREADGLVDAQPADVFLAYTVDVDAERALSALVTMARRRWLPSTDASGDAEVVTRLLQWCRRQGWDTTHDILARASGSYLDRRDLGATHSA
jgi:predicted nucleic acid-binding protein